MDESFSFYLTIDLQGERKKGSSVNKAQGAYKYWALVFMLHKTEAENVDDVQGKLFKFVFLYNQSPN